MQVFKFAVGLCAAVSLSACGAPEEPVEQEALARQESTLVTGTTQGCTFTISAVPVPGSMPPREDLVVTRAASSTCAYGAGSVTLGASYGTMYRALLANSYGVATAYSYKPTPSGSSMNRCQVNHIDPATLSIVRSTDIVVMYGTQHVQSCALDQTDGGSTLVVYGTKGGPLPGEVGNRPNYVATYYNFFTSTTPPVYYTY
ncbi:hypothetical protein [Comamonas sp. JC664]|uniref:hypothetical protein n=1 Tax=Comamonas sp. JC664 TaxID=2801917 RepID=UPI00191F9824|nr:hypothetical protein [Comamonas sp. JC664]MBL0694837.1 hypothetical protein [Comamonas sp. JC664]GHG94832.1 hypothetical protein GCM10012319_58130 [Comamonas sp. KCTC 72670]